MMEFFVKIVIDLLSQSTLSQMLQESLIPLCLYYENFTQNWIDGIFMISNSLPISRP